MKSAGHDTCCGKNPFPCKRLHGFSANGAAPPPRGGGRVRSRITGWIGELGRAGGDAGGRRKPVPEGLAAASMPRTPPPSPPARPLTQSGGSARHGKKKEEQEQRQKLHSGLLLAGPTPTPLRTEISHPRMAWIYRVDQGRHPPGIAIYPPSPGNCRRRGGVGWQDRWRHGWRHRAPRGEGALLAKHCFASARTHSRQRLGRSGGSRRVLPTHTAPPNTQKPRAALALDLPASGRHYRGCRVQPCKDKGRLSAASLFFTSA